MEKGNEGSAVSEVIGEVLIIALVVTLAGIIGAMVFGLFGSMPQSTIVGVTAERNDALNVSVTYHGGEKQDMLNFLTIAVNSTDPLTMGFTAGGDVLNVGNSTVVHAPVPGNDHIIVVGHFSDGSALVVLDTFV